MTSIDRRAFLARTAAAGAAAGLAGIGLGPALAAEPLVKGLPNAEKLGWRVGFSAYTFRALTAFEALDQIAATGLHYAEMFSWQKLSPKHPDATTSPELSKPLRGELKAKAAGCGVKMIGLYSTMGNRATAEAAFEFAADMGIEVIVGEPPADLFEYIDSLAAKHKVDFALHNHPKPSGFWNPETGLAAMKGRSERMGFCCDTGHWCRSGLEPVEMLKKIGKRAKTFHLKDLDQFGVPQAGDVVWGEGKGRIADILAEVKRLGIQKPYFGIEWERTTNEPLETHAKSAAFFEKVAARLVSS